MSSKRVREEINPYFVILQNSPFINHLYIRLFRVNELAICFFTREDVVRLFVDGATDVYVAPSRTTNRMGIMQPISLWLLMYALPAFVTGGIVQFSSRYGSNPTRDALIIHAGLVTSIFASQYAIKTLGLAFPWQPQLLSLIICAASILFAMRMLGLFGMWYSLSAFLQQLTILSVSFLLRSFLSLPVVLFLVVPIFSLGHAQNVAHRRIRVILISLWGVASILLFRVLPDVYLLASLHTLLGTIGIRRSIVYP